MIWVLIGVLLLMSVILHEIAHGYVANLCGDPTAQRMGRLTLNPIPHIDPIGTVVLPALLIASGAPILFGWAKPVPVAFSALNNPKRDMVKVAAAGPAVNILIAVVCALVVRVTGGFAEPTIVTTVAVVTLNINIVLAVLNLVPILPLDGGRILVGLLPRAQAIAFARLEPYGMFIVIALLATGMLSRIIGPVRDLLIHALL